MKFPRGNDRKFPSIKGKVFYYHKLLRGKTLIIINFQGKVFDYHKNSGGKSLEILKFPRGISMIILNFLNKTLKISKKIPNTRELKCSRFLIKERQMPLFSKLISQ